MLFLSFQGKADGDAFHPAHFRLGFPPFIFRGDHDGGGIQLGSQIYFFVQVLLLLRQRADLSGRFVVLAFYLFILRSERLVDLVQRIDLYDIAAQDGAYSLQLFLQSHDLVGVASLHLPKFFEQSLGFQFFFF